MNLAIETRSLRPFMRLLEEGVTLQVPEGRSVREALTVQFGMDPRYLEDRVKTLFLNGKPVDDLDRTRVGKGSILALSAAMPGLAGATLRREGSLAAMRQRIEPGALCPDPGDALKPVTVKLFNMVARDLGPSLFKRGIPIPGKRLRDFLKGQKPALETACTRIVVNDDAVSLSRLVSMDFGGTDVLLTLTVHG